MEGLIINYKDLTKASKDNLEKSWKDPTFPITTLRVKKGKHAFKIECKQWT